MRTSGVGRVGAIFAVLLVLAGCYRSPVNPPRLVTSGSSDLSIQLFMQATILLSNYYGYSTIRYAEIQERAARSGLQMLPFMPPETVRATPELVGFFNNYQNNPAELERALRTYGGYKALVKYYIRTGLRASQSLCRAYLLDLEERSAYLEFLQKEIGVVAALSTSILALVNANATLSQAFLIGRAGLDAGIDVYQEYRFLNIDREAARTVIEAAQNALAEHYLRQVDSAHVQSNSVIGGYTFSDALHAVSMIEYQCTRSGIRSLLTRSINNTPTNLTVDPVTGTFVFRSTRQGAVTMSPPGPPRMEAPPPIVVPGGPVAVPPRERPVVVAPSPGPGPAPDRPPSQPPRPAAQNFAAIVSGFNERLHPPERVFSVLRKLCVRTNESPTTPRVNSLIKVYQVVADPMGNPASATGQLTDAQMTSLQEINTNCPEGRENFYEWQDGLFQSGVNSPAVTSLLNKRLRAADRFPEGRVVPIADVRRKIPLVRGNVTGLVLNDRAFAEQITPDLVQQLRALPQLQ